MVIRWGADLLDLGDGRGGVGGGGEGAVWGGGGGGRGLQVWVVVLGVVVVVGGARDHPWRLGPAGAHGAWSGGGTQVAPTPAWLRVPATALLPLAILQQRHLGGK